MVIMEWIRKITDIIMPEPNEDEDEVKDTKKVETKTEEPIQEVAAEKKAEQSEPQFQQARQTENVQRQAAAGMGMGGKTFTRTGGTVSTADNGVTSMNGVRYEAHNTGSSEASVRPSLAVVKTPQITMKIYTPLKYDEQVKAIGQDLIKRSAVLVNYEGVDDSAQQRIGDFVLGVVYTISGRVEMITSKIVLYVPEGFEIENAQAALASMRRYN